jgi:leucyl aminopeptidase
LWNDGFLANLYSMKPTLNIIQKSKTPSVPLIAVRKADAATWIKKQPKFMQNWLAVNGFRGEAGQFCLIPDNNGELEQVICGIGDAPDTWSLSAFATTLPPQVYHLEGNFSAALATQMTLGWALAGYTFTRYKKNEKKLATLVAPKGCDFAYAESMAEAIFWARDLINTPAADMHPAALANEAATFGRVYGGKVSVIKGEALLKANYPTVYTVGKAAEVPPHLVDIRFGRKGAKKVTLVGKGITFDSGGLDIKPSGAMKMMKKDMAGVAIMLALAKVILDTKLPVELRLVLPMAENAVGERSMRPLDIVKTRKGITVEIGNTDAEGRLVLCDALAAADEESPDLLIDVSTLTGAARVAVGTEMSAFFTPDDKLADAAQKQGEFTNDPLWRLPLYKPYRSFLDTKTADLSNDPESSYAGAITAALYLKEFVENTKSWLHLDMMAWNLSNKPGRPQGAEAMGVRALYALVKEKYGKKN